MTISLNNGHRQAWNANIIVGLGRGIDDTQPNLLAGFGKEHRVLVSRLAIHEEGVGGTCDVGNIGRVHPHPLPGQSFANDLTQRHARCLHLVIDICQGRPLEIVIALYGFEITEHIMRVFKCPVRQDNRMLNVVINRVCLGGVDD